MYLSITDRTQSWAHADISEEESCWHRLQDFRASISPEFIVNEWTHLLTCESSSSKSESSSMLSSLSMCAFEGVTHIHGCPRVTLYSCSLENCIRPRSQEKELYCILISDMYALHYSTRWWSGLMRVYWASCYCVKRLANVSIDAITIIYRD